MIFPFLQCVEMNMGITKRPHAVVLAIPTQGHIKPMMQFSKILSARGFYITFVNTEFIQAKMTKSGSGNSMADFRFETLPDGLPPHHGRTTQVDELCKSISENWPPLFEELIEKLEKSLDVPPLTCIVYNSHLSWAQKTAKRLGIPGICFWTASACGLNIYFSAPLLMEKGFIPLKDKSYLTNGYLEEELTCVPGMPLLRMKDVPSLYYDDKPLHFRIFNTPKPRLAMTADFMLINTFDELEEPVMQALRARFPVYGIGPLLLSAAAAAEQQNGTVQYDFCEFMDRRKKLYAMAGRSGARFCCLCVLWKHNSYV
ncbi:hypothetical protein KI387_039157 [Taxus chinensis]|uniref:UDP-glycosyltransferase n=1 Tax=Taxus chinensis TaxID=29808 RepID=A0AA38F7K4_TAXCH|nr:hypothetical protein KI387_039157 [Taxus chinensis]